MVKTGVIILCRYNSKRLKGKILREIDGRSILMHIVENVAKVFPSDSLVVATSTEESDDPIVKYCIDNDLNYYRGSLNNVGLRFLNCALKNEFDYAIRINGDNFFIDTLLLNQVKADTETGKFDFISNVQDRTYPKGMSIEAVRVSFYKEKFPQIDQEERYREHVTLFFYENPPDKTRYFYNTTVKDAAGIALAIDTMEDFEIIEKMYELLRPLKGYYNLKDIYESYCKVKNG